MFSQASTATELGTNLQSTTQQEEYYDLTAQISENTVVYPGDPIFKSEDICSLENGSQFHLCQMHLGNHTGTHIDFPAHVIKGGKTSSDFLIKNLIGSGLIIEVPDIQKSITQKFITEQPILKNDFVFFRTSNSKLSKQSKFSDKYVYLEIDAAQELLKKGVKIVGIDYISVDQYEAEDLPVHKLLLSHDVLIVEGLELNNVPLGRCKIYIMPVNIQKMDGLPARVVAQV
jgi:arylformamidase